MLWILGSLGLLIIAGLAFYAGRLLMQLKQQNDQQAAAAKARNATLIESITTIAKAMQQAQCESSEGCLRIWVLLDHLIESPKPNYQATYPGIFQMYDVVKDMPTHTARKKYPKKEIRQMDETRLQAEKDLALQINQDLDKLLIQLEG
ncbi:DUF2489 domain-containing protein [Algicola sagamiensis]|uniref:DUF2489 domain-containing protein n=1 Tax=Algicola sagamiensis TaxID=163869 RepID=UPI00035F26F8|nr:DUF2489 domain-containing protein [Algicola sagamiensis]